MRTTTLYLEATAEAISHMSAPIPDVQLAISHMSAPIPDAEPAPSPSALAAAQQAATEAAWDAFERATFPTLNR